MQFYKAIGIIKKGTKRAEIISRTMEEGWKEEVQETTVEFDGRIGKKEAVFLSMSRSRAFVFGIAAASKERAEELIKDYLVSMELQLVISLEELTFESFGKLVTNANRRAFLNDSVDILEKLGVAGLDKSGRYGLYFGENLIMESSRKKCEKGACHYMMDGTMLPEIDRIYRNTEGGIVQGHPVHYIVRTDDREVRRESCRILLSALYERGRVRNRRYVFTDIDPNGRFSQKFLSDIYESAEGGAVILRFNPTEDSEEDEYADSERDVVKSISELVNQHRHKVLTMLCLPRECTRIRGCFEESLSGLGFVELSEDMVCGDRAKAYLKALCKEQGVQADKALYSKVKEEEQYLAVELRSVFDQWFDKKLKKDCYPQYAEFTVEKERIAKEKPKGTAYDELMEMVGLDSAKEVINNALDYFKAQKVFADKGMTSERPSMHMVFTGNPGSAKTTVARLFARIMRENGVLSKGHMVECGRGDLVGKFVGWTAKIVQDKFKEAAGGVLFIDEAYSLVDDRGGSFGDEAINTIVQEMENHRDDCVVIFAGYPDKMSEFLDKNPGLRSRIAFHVPFEDYNKEELLDIASLISKKKGLCLTVGAQKKLGEIFEEARRENDFGNGRFARNMIEQAKMAQASRLLKMDLDTVSKEDVATITEEDIRVPEAVKKEADHKVMGFVC